MEYMFRDLTAEEVDCRVAMASEKGVSLLLYKDARCDQAILDETVGPFGWQRRHCRENANCVVSIRDKETGQWIEKEDTGTESNTEKEKGLASDSFKRACTNWGIGRELYTAPFIWVKAADCAALNKDDRTGRYQCKDAFRVAEMAVKNKKIVRLAIVNDRLNGRKVFEWTAGGYSAAEDGKAVCEICGGTVIPAKRRDGSIWPVSDILAYGTTAFHKVLCAGCIAKELKKNG